MITNKHLTSRRRRNVADVQVLCSRRLAEPEPVGLRDLLRSASPSPSDSVRCLRRSASICTDGHAQRLAKTGCYLTAVALASYTLHCRLHFGIMTFNKETETMYRGLTPHKITPMSGVIGIGAGLRRAPPTPPSMRVRTRRFISLKQACSIFLTD